MTLKHFLDLDAFDGAMLRRLIDDAKRMKNARNGRPKGAADDALPLKGRMLALVFEKPSTRTRISFDMGMRQLGGECMFLDGRDMQFGHGETVGDTARVLSRYVDAIMFRTSAHDRFIELRDHASVPVINALTDDTHPCQILADIMTFEEHRGPIKGKIFAWVGDGNNVLHSLLEASAQFGFALNIATPKGREPNIAYVNWAKANGANVMLTNDPHLAAKNADCIDQPRHAEHQFSGGGGGHFCQFAVRFWCRCKSSHWNNLAR